MMDTIKRLSTITSTQNSYQDQTSADQSASLARAALPVVPQILTPLPTVLPAKGKATPQAPIGSLISLPLELITEIVAVALENRDPPLSILIQVSRVWAHEARRQQFASLHVKCSSRDTSTSGILDCAVREAAGNLPLPFGPFVHELHLTRDQRDNSCTEDIILQVRYLLEATTNKRLISHL
jgi:hypothetical protein